MIGDRMMSDDNGLSGQLRINLIPGPHYQPDVEASPAPLDAAVRIVAYYLPQFHPIPENDIWWGKGFTEWTNVSKALPQFPGHYQPRLPGELGFYDLRLVDMLRRQAALARKYGIHGFCFHYYWFGGKRLLETPLNLLLQNRDIDLPFCICWANENWTRRLDGQDNEILIAQSHSDDDDIAFASSLEPALRDPRYIHVKDRPLILLYRPSLLPNALATARRWRTHFTRGGYGDPYLVMVQSFDNEDPRLYGFDAAVEMPPHRVGYGVPRINSELQFFDPSYQGSVHDYGEMVRRAVAMPPSPFKQFRGVCPSWDDEARKPGRGTVFAHSTPHKYAHWLRAVCNIALENQDPSERLVFVNAWNEWAEGATLEPDRHYGYAYLRATARVLRLLDERAPHLRIAVISHDAYFHGAQMLALHIVRSLVWEFGAEVRVLLGGPGELEEAFHQVAPCERVETGFADPAAWEEAGRRLREDGISTILCNTLVSAQAIEPLRRSGLRVIELVHELPSLIRAYGLVDAARTAARHANTIVFASDFVRDRFIELAGKIVGRSVICPQGVFLPPAPDSERLRQRAEMRNLLGAGSDDLIVAGIGYGDRRKGIDMWPGLIRRVLTECPDTLFVWAGRIEESIARAINEELDRAGIGDRLRLPGNLQPLQPLYAAADVFVLSSREDPFPNVVLEAMAHGLPVVAFEASGGITGLIQETGSKLLPFEDIDAMAREVVRLLRDKDARIAIGEAGARRIARDFQFRNYVSSLMTLALGSVHTVSVVVPNYNYARFLRQRLDSIWSQTYSIHEVILLDDASTDDSAAVIAELEHVGRGRLRVVRNDVNSGAVSRQWARGVELATGELVWIAEADDFADPGFLAASVPAFDEPEVVLSYTQSRQVSDDGQVLAEDYLDYVADIDPTLWRTNYRRSGRVEIAEALSVKNTIPNVSAVVFRRAALARVLQDYREQLTSYHNAADWFCYLQLLTSGSIAYTATSLNCHRRHARSVTLSAVGQQRHLQEIGSLQRLAAELVQVRPNRTGVARAWYDEVARMFGIVRENSGSNAAPGDKQDGSLTDDVPRERE
jgi:glycosyltransferase involved in cell wall biosynthesis